MSVFVKRKSIRHQLRMSRADRLAFRTTRARGRTAYNCYWLQFASPTLNTTITR